MRVHIDMDGVLANFDLGIVRHYGKYFADIDQGKFWNNDVVKLQFFARLEIIPSGIAMLNSLSHAIPEKLSILTSTGGGEYHLEIAQQKLSWLRKMGRTEMPVAFATSTLNKALFARPGDILVDDREKVIEAWESAGGRGILFEREGWDQIVEEVVRAVT